MSVKFFGPLVGLGFFFALAAAPAAAAQAARNERVVKDGSVVSLEYTLTGTDGKLIETNKGKEPFRYTQGRQEMIPGLERELAGMKVGAEKKITVKPEDAYGPVHKEAFREVPKERIPPEALKVGAELTARGPQGQAMPVRVHEIREKTVVIDMNHPMAGKTLVFNVKILDIQDGPPPNKK
ncbi:MAG TPA: peptidylprolyl isomerase [candidate division Zixibacteria bacterium]|nr:peptidylprolyl isomerase [candidate division Zixibacteria bacterium]